MQVYHGSYTEIFHIDLSKSHANKDFGKGFYVTKFRNHAESWKTSLPKFCENCADWQVCKGGCRAASEQCFGRLDVEDPILSVFNFPPVCL